MKNRFTLAFCLIAIAGFSQNNLVPNPTFEKIEKKVKLKGEINRATPWISPTLAKADLYIPNSKNFNISVPENTYGKEKPMKGTGYAGIVAYSLKSKEPRTYLQVKLTEKMEAGKVYCVKYHVSLADLSQYASNHLGAAITENEMVVNNSEILNFATPIESKKLMVYDQQYYWVPICGAYTAKGGEEYLTIGNFTAEDKLKTIKIKRPKGFNKPQKPNAYYYIDNVSVSEDLKKCQCDKLDGLDRAKVVTSGFGSSDKQVATTTKIINSDGTTKSEAIEVAESASTSVYTEAAGVVSPSVSKAPIGKVDGMKIMFESGKFSVEKYTDHLDKVAAYLKNNTRKKVVVSGFIDSSEKDVLKLAGKRASTVYKYILSKGVEANRVIRKIAGISDSENKLKNMKVVISVESL